MKYFAANWKLNKSPLQAKNFIASFLSKYKPSANSKVIIFPTAMSIDSVLQSLNSAQIEVGMQNCFFENQGAFTGENSAQFLKEMGGQWVLCGHSERRTLFHESDEVLQKKFAHILKLGLKPMLCIGETLQEREAGKTNEVLHRQLRSVLANISKENFFAIAYEPVWAIGTGKVASNLQISETHAYIRKQIDLMSFVTAVPILYGGSVKAENAHEIIQIPNVDGFLVGGASLEVESFLQIISGEDLHT